MNGAEQNSLLAAMQRINEAWLNGRVEELAPMMHEQIVMVLPGFSGRITGREQLLAGFKDFVDNAKIEEFRDYEQESDVAGDTGVVTFRYEMLYERARERYRASGRDLWIFQRHGDGWIAVWRAMLDAEEKAA